MIFNSFGFFAFLTFALAIYACVPQKHRKFFIAIVSYYFYSFWSLKFCLLIFASTIGDYWFGIKIDESINQKTRFRFLLGSLAMNLGILGFFKYYGFFAESLIDTLNWLGIESGYKIWRVILPVGVSFYTFQSMTYTINVYRKIFPARRNFIDFSAFVSFFPQLLAGPIERPEHIFPQLNKLESLKWKNTIAAIELFGWGLFKKIVIADNIASIVDSVFDVKNTQAGSDFAFLGLYAFGIQVFCDFSGYTDMARGLARLFGVQLVRNFNEPYSATSMQDFWNRWHISLTTWFRDYVFLPLCFNPWVRVPVLTSTFLVFLLSGLWHGAAWTFVLWGAYHGALLVIEKRFAIREYRGKNLGVRLLRTAFVFQLVSFSWIFFRSGNMGTLKHWFQIASSFHFTENAQNGYLTFLFCALGLYLMSLWYKAENKSKLSQTAFAIILYLSIVIFGNELSREFIYFQF